MAFGIIDTTYLDFPANVSNDYIRNLETRSGLSVAQLLTAVDGELRAINAGTDPLIATLLAGRTTETFVTASRSDRMAPQVRTEYDTPRPQLVEQRGNMLAIKGYDLGLGFTEDGLEAISMPAFNDNLRAMREGWEALHRREALNRLFSAAEVPIEPGQTATSPGLAGSGTGGNVFAGTLPNGQVINTGTYTHYIRDTTANRAAAIKAARNLIKVWYPGPFDLLGSQTAIDAIVALGAANGFVGTGSALIRPADSTATTVGLNPDDYVGVFDNDIRVRQPIVDIQGDYVVVYKSFGAMNARNPLILRYDALKGPDVIVRSREMYPLANAVSKQDFGYNINNRVAAAPVLFAASGGYVPPTIV